ncbi:MAG: N-acetylmuramoyl-L-alanine amidase [Blastocatellia bacterium]
MAFSLLWLPDVLEAAGLKVSTVRGWETRGRGDVGRIFGVICHHTVGPKTENMPSLRTLVNGRSDLPGPLAQLGLGRDGTFYVIAAGRCNHAGRGLWQGVATGNTNFIGIEGENPGTSADLPWPDIQMKAYHHGVAAILKHINRGVEFCAGHKEFALPKGRKPDPLFDMNEFRSNVASILSGTAPPLPRIPVVESGNNGRPTLRRGATGDFVKQIQTRVNVTPVNGNFGPVTEAAVRAFQRDHGIVPDGIVGPKTWAVLDTVIL